MLRHYGCYLGNSLTCNSFHPATVKGCDVATAPANGFLSAGKRLLTCCNLRSAMHSPIPGETLLYEGVYVDAKVGPFVTDNEVVRDASMHLIRRDLLGTFAEHESAACLWQQMRSEQDER